MGKQGILALPLEEYRTKVQAFKAYLRAYVRKHLDSQDTVLFVESREQEEQTLTAMLQTNLMSKKIKQYKDMSAQSYIKFWTAEPSEHEVQAYNLLGYSMTCKETTPNGKVTGKTYGGKIRVSIAGFPTEELLEWMFNSRILKAR